MLVGWGLGQQAEQYQGRAVGTDRQTDRQMWLFESQLCHGLTGWDFVSSLKL